jgi:hypothetical protein
MRSTVTTVVAAQSPYTVLSSDATILCNAASGAITLNLPASASHRGRHIEVIKTDSSTNACTIDGNASETIMGMTTHTLSRQYESIHMQSDASNWQAPCHETLGNYGELDTTPPLAYTVTVADTGTFYEVAPTSAVDSDSGACFDSSASGRLRYTCAETRTFHCAATVSYTPASGTNQVLMFRLSDNGTTDANTEIRDTVSATASDSTALHGMMTLSQNEYVSLYARNSSATNNITIDTLNIFCMAGH